MSTPTIEHTKSATRWHVRITLPDGNVYGIDAPASIRPGALQKLIASVVEDEASRRMLDELKGINLVKSPRSQKLRIYKERST